MTIFWTESNRRLVDRIEHQSFVRLEGDGPSPDYDGFNYLFLDDKTGVMTSKKWAETGGVRLTSVEFLRKCKDLRPKVMPTTEESKPVDPEMLWDNIGHICWDGYSFPGESLVGGNQIGKYEATKAYVDEKISGEPAFYVTIDSQELRQTIMNRSDITWPGGSRPDGYSSTVQFYLYLDVSRKVLTAGKFVHVESCDIDNSEFVEKCAELVPKKGTIAGADVEETIDYFRGSIANAFGVPKSLLCGPSVSIDELKKTAGIAYNAFDGGSLEPAYTYNRSDMSESGFVDANGQELRIGDEVKLQYSNTFGVVKGFGVGTVSVLLDSGKVLSYGSNVIECVNKSDDSGLSKKWSPTEQDYEECCGTWVDPEDGDVMKVVPESGVDHVITEVIDMEGNLDTVSLDWWNSRDDFHKDMKGYDRIEGLPSQCIPRKEEPVERYEVRFPLLAGILE